MQTVRKDIHNSEVPVLCQSCEARHQGICGALNPEQLLALSRHTRRVRREPGQARGGGKLDIGREPIGVEPRAAEEPVAAAGNGLEV